MRCLRPLHEVPLHDVFQPANARRAVLRPFPLCDRKQSQTIRLQYANIFRIQQFPVSVTTLSREGDNVP